MSKRRFCSKVFNGMKRNNFNTFGSFCNWVGSWCTREERDFFWQYVKFFYWAYKWNRCGKSVDHVAKRSVPR